MSPLDVSRGRVELVVEAMTASWGRDAGESVLLCRLAQRVESHCSVLFTRLVC